MFRAQNVPRLTAVETFEESRKITQKNPYFAKQAFNSIISHVSFGEAVMAYDYEELLRKARSQLPEVASKRERLELPALYISIIGMRTIVRNFKEVADALNRGPQHILKFLTGELATAATMQESRVIFKGKFSQQTLQKLLGRYMDAFVTCPVCKRPDTKIVKEKRLSFLVCDACGARSSVKHL